MSKIASWLSIFAPPKGAIYLFWLPAAIAATAGLVQSWHNRRNDKANIKRQQQANAALSAQEFAQNTESMRMLNQYNDPSAQMARLQQAGLSPSLIYGSGAGGASGNQSSAPQYRARETNMSMSPIQLPDMISQYQNFQMKQAQIDNVKANTENLQERTISEPVARWLKQTLGEKSASEREKLLALMPHQLSVAESQATRGQLGIASDTQKLQNLRQDELLKILVGQQKTQQMGTESIRQGLLSAETEKKQAELLFQRYKNEWIKQGVTTSDNLMVRMFVKMLNETGMSISDGWEKLKETGGKILRPENWMGRKFLPKK